MTRVLIVESPYYGHIAQPMRELATAELAKLGASWEIVQVPGAFEIPGAIAMALAGGAGFDGFVALGCVIRGETSHYQHVCEECARGLQDLAVRERAAIGFGVLTVDTEAQALKRIPRSAISAVQACVTMIELRRRFGLK